jgi:hypothetical protein
MEKCSFGNSSHRSLIPNPGEAMRVLPVFALVALLAAHVEAQRVIFVNNVTQSAPLTVVPQVIPDPMGGAPGTVELFMDLCGVAPNQTFWAYCTGLPSNYTHGMVTQETIVFSLNFGASATPGTTILGGEFLIPLTPPPTTFLFTSATYIGPVGCGTGMGSFGGTLIGRVQNLNPLIAGAFQGINLTMQATVLDSVLGLAFCSNAVNFIV